MEPRSERPVGTMLPGVKLAGWLIGTSAELGELSVYEMHSETSLGAVVLREAECFLQTLSVLRLIV